MDFNFNFNLKFGWFSYSFLLTFILWFLLFTCSQGRDFYLSTTGTQNVKCDFQNPCSTFKFIFALNIQDGDSIYLFPGIYSGEDNSNIDVKYNITVAGLNGSSVTNITLPGNSRLFNLKATANLNLYGITIMNGRVTGNGGVILSAGGSSLYVDQCQFYNNSVTSGKGGVFYIDKGTNFVLTNCVFSSNSADFGGSIFSEYSSVSIDNCLFTKNNGGSYAAIQCYSCTAFNVTNSLFSQNTASSIGGAMGITGISVYFRNLIFQSNFARSEGGCIGTSASTLKIYDTLFDDCRTNGNGGAIMADSGAGIHCYNCTFTNNLGLFYGGGICSIGAVLNIVDSTFINNKCGDNGGGISLSGGRANFTRSTLIKNGGGNGGGISLQSRSNLGLNETNIMFNDGAGIICSDSRAWIYHSNLANNTNGPILCLTIPSYTWCTISGDSDWATYCGEQPLNSASGFLMPMFVIVGIVISGVVLVVCIVAAAFCLFHRGAKKKPPAIPTGIWKEVPTRPDAEDGELLNDYD